MAPLLAAEGAVVLDTRSWGLRMAIAAAIAAVGVGDTPLEYSSRARALPLANRAPLAYVPARSTGPVPARIKAAQTVFQHSAGSDGGSAASPALFPRDAVF